MRLHLGCGRRHLPGYVNVDARASVHPDVQADIGHLPVEDGAARLIYACHLLEHIRRPDVGIVLAEWRRVLRPGGILRVAVPNFDALAFLYAEGVPLWRLIGPMMGRQDYPENTHYIAFDYDYLAWHLTEAAFHTVRRWSLPHPDFPDGWDDYSQATIDGLPISLNVEAIRG